MEKETHEEIISKCYKKACDKMDKAVEKQKASEAPFAFDARDAVIEAPTTSKPMVNKAANIYTEAEKCKDTPSKHFKVARSPFTDATH